MTYCKPPGGVAVFLRPVWLVLLLGALLLAGCPDPMGSASSDATLASLTVSAGTLTPAFESETTAYAVEVGNDVTAITINAASSHPAAVLEPANGTLTKDLIEGSGNIFAITVTAEDGAAKKTYTVTVTRAAAAKSSDASLASLALNAGALNPAFSAETTAYTVSVGNAVTSLTVTAAANHEAAALNPADGTLTKELIPGSPVFFEITVTAEDGAATKTYTVAATRAGAARSSDASLASLALSAGTLTPAFDAETTAYTVSVGNAVASLTLTAAARHDAATLTPGGGTLTKELIPGSPVFFEITVTAEDGAATKTYTVAATRAGAARSSDASLASLALSAGTLTPAFGAETTAYTVSVGNAVTSLTLTAAARHNAAALTPEGGILTKELIPGSPVFFEITVTAEDGTTARTYSVTVTRATVEDENSGAKLKALTVSAGTLVPAFNAETTAYTLMVGNDITSLTVTGQAAYDGAALNPAGGVLNKTLNVGSGNVFAIAVTAKNGASTRTYTVTVTRAAKGNESDDASLKSLVASAGTLTPAFSPETTAYTVSVGNDVAGFTVSAQANHAAAVLDPANGTLTKSLNTGSGNVFAIAVTAENGTARTYTVTVTRAAKGNESGDASLKSLALSAGTLAPAFSPGTTAYTVSVGNDVAGLTVTAQANHAAAVLNPASGIVTKTLNTGSGNVFAIVVTAEDGTSRTYSITVTRAKNSDASLKSLTISSGTLVPAFKPETTAYTVSVENSVTSLTAAAQANHAAAVLDPANGTLTKALNTGSGNVFAIAVTAENGTARTYTVTVTRAKNSDAALKSLAVSSGTLVPAFSAGTTAYTVSVENSVTSLAVSAQANHAAAVLDPANGTVTKNLNTGSGNVFVIVVTAENGTAAKTYTVTVTRATSSDASLKSLAVSSGTLVPAFKPETTAYTVSVENGVTSLAVTAQANHAAAVLDPANGTLTKPLNTGSGNVLAIAVTAEDGTARTYTVTVTRAKSSDASLKSLAASSGTLVPAFSAGTTAYTVSVENSVTGLAVTAQANHAAAVLDPADGIVTKTLNVGSDNVFAITVTAEDGAATKTYTVTVTRAATKSSDASLKSLTVSAGTLVPAFKPETTAYTVSVENEVTSLTVSAQANHAAAVLNPANGTLTKTLNVGSGNVFEITVTAENGTAAKTQVTVTRAAPPPVWGENPGEALEAPALLPYGRQITVSWKAVTGASAYQVYYGPAGNSEAIQKAGSDTTGTNRNITGLEAGASYDVYVRALMPNGQNRLSVKGTVSLVPAAPVGLSARYTAPGELDLSWTASRGTVIYHVYYSLGVNDSAQAQFRDYVEDPVYSFTSLQNGAVYYFWVKAENSGGASAFSASATIAMSMPPPGNITISSLNEKIRLNWVAVQGAESYDIRYALTANFPDGALTQTTTADNITLTGLQNDAEYSLQVRSVHTGGVSEWSAVVKETPRSSGAAPAVPVVVRVGRSADHSAPRIVLMWNPVAGAEYYEVSYSVGSDPNGGAKINPVSDNACEITTGLTAGTSYNVWVRALNDSGSSGWSASVYPQTPGAGFDPRVYGIYFSRYPTGRAYYMDGYQIGSVSGMTSEFPFNTTKFPDYPAGFPAMFKFGGRDVRKELVSGYQIQGDDQYLFYNDLTRFGWPFLGIVRMIFDEPNDTGKYDLTLLGNRTGYVLIEYLKGCEPFSGDASGYFIIKFTINETGPNPWAKDAYATFRGCNFLSGLASLALPHIKPDLMKDNDAGVAFPSIRLGSYIYPNTPDADSLFHPSLLPPEPLNRWATGEKSTDEECWPAVAW